MHTDVQIQPYSRIQGGVGGGIVFDTVLYCAVLTENILSSAMEEAGRYVGENINAGNYTIERYYQRGK